MEEIHSAVSTEKVNKFEFAINGDTTSAAPAVICMIPTRIVGEQPPVKHCLKVPCNLILHLDINP